MNKIIACDFNIDSRCVKLIYAGGYMIAINRTAVENSSETTINGRPDMG